MQLAARPALVCDALTPFAAHFFTTRGWRLGERTESAVDGWKEIAAAAGVDASRLGRLQQVHGADCVTYKKGTTAGEGAPPQADIVLSDDPAIAVAIQTADCLPILIVDRRTKAVSAAHAGWRGLVARVPAVATERMVRDVGSDVNDLLVAVGPAIGACCYEVGEEVREQFERAGFTPTQIDRWLSLQPLALSPENPPMRALTSTRRPDHWFFDGWSCVREQLEAAGVRRDQIFIAELCTASHEASFCSYRRDGAVAGRLAAVIRRRN